MSEAQDQGDADVVVTDDTDQGRFEARVDGTVVGYAEYERGEGVVELTHTVVDDDAEGQGVGSALASYALEQIRDAGLRVVPTCSFMAGYLERHPEHADLVAPSR